MMELFKQYREQLHERIKEIRTAAEDGDANRLARLAHNFKGVSLNFSADGLASLARNLEEGGKHEDLSNAPALCVQLEEEALRVAAYLSENGL
jgi:HPt (histidine-containing phosphotransfer) domain-containing protein